MAHTKHFTVRPSALRSDQPLTFDLYVRLGSRHILYLRKTDRMDAARLQKIKDKKVDKLFIPLDQKPLFEGYMKQNISAAFENATQQSYPERARIISGVIQGAIEDVFENPDNSDLYKVARESANRLTQCLAEPPLIRELLRLENTDGDVAQHSVYVATLSLAIAEKLGLTKTHPVYLLALGAMLHDFGHAKAGLDLNRSIDQMRVGERDVYMKHPTQARAELRKFTFYDPLVVTIVAQHEERLDGSGFPEKIFGSAVETFSLIVATANQFDRYITYEKTPHRDALKKFLVEQIGRLDLKHMTALQEVLKENELV